MHLIYSFRNFCPVFDLSVTLKTKNALTGQGLSVTFTLEGFLPASNQVVQVLLRFSVILEITLIISTSFPSLSAPLSPVKKWFCRLMCSCAGCWLLNHHPCCCSLLWIDKKGQTLCYSSAIFVLQLKWKVSLFFKEHTFRVAKNVLGGENGWFFVHIYEPEEFFWRCDFLNLNTWLF